MFSISRVKVDERLVHRTQRLVHRQPSGHGFSPRVSEGALQQFHLFAAQGLLETQAFLSEFQQAFALVGFGRDAVDQVHFLQLAQGHVQCLLAHAEQFQ